jgi:hypothetical protein
MGRWERIVAKVEAMDEDEREAVAAALEAVLADRQGESVLTPEQVAEVERRLAEPVEYASDEEVEAFFAEYAKP